MPLPDILWERHHAYLIFSLIFVRYRFMPSASLFSMMVRRFFSSVRMLATCDGVRGLKSISCNRKSSSLFLERSARRFLVLHDGGKDEGGHERDAERVGHRLIVLLEGVFKDVQLQRLVEVLRCSASASGRGP